jgi:GT2 family glycosyltransferase
VNNVWPKVFIIILNWNGWEDTVECLESLYNISYPRYEVVIVDNNSEDDSLAKIRAYSQGELAVESSFFPQSGRNEPLTLVEYTREEAECITEANLAQESERRLSSGVSHRQLVIIQNEKNFGYPEGNNIGIRFALKAVADYVLLLNNDTVVDKNFLNELVSAAERDIQIGVIGPKMYWYHAPQTIQSTGARVNLWTGGAISLNWDKTDDELGLLGENGLLPVDYVFGACFLVKRKVIEAVGGLDPIFFLYGEEVDWCMRIGRAGYKIVCNINSKIWHKGMASTSKAKHFSEYYLERGRMIYMRKYARTLQFLSFLLFWPPYCAAFLIKKRRASDIPYFIKGFLDGLFVHLNPLPDTDNECV